MAGPLRLWLSPGLGAAGWGGGGAGPILVRERKAVGWEPATPWGPLGGWQAARAEQAGLGESAEPEKAGGRQGPGEAWAGPRVCVRVRACVCKGAGVGGEGGATGWALPPTPSTAGADCAWGGGRGGRGPSSPAWEPCLPLSQVPGTPFCTGAATGLPGLEEECGRPALGGHRPQDRPHPAPAASSLKLPHPAVTRSLTRGA